MALLANVDLIHLNSVEGKFKMNDVQKVEHSCVQPNGMTIFFFFFGQEINANEHLHISSSKQTNKNYFVHTIMYIIHLLTKKKKIQEKI